MPFAAAQSDINTALLDVATGINILAVEDDIIARTFLEAQIAELGHTMTSADNGQDALDILAANTATIDVVLMDREMPVMDGLEAVRRMKENPALRSVPVIMVTGADSTAEMSEGLDVGVFYYLTKPVNEDMLRSVLSAAVREAEQLRTLADELGQHRASFDLIDTCRFRFQTLSEAESLAAFAANCFPNPKRVVSGLGELLVNAIEHGNLGIGYDQKTALLDASTWRIEIDRLQQSREFREKFSTITIARKDDGIYAIVQDQGVGFPWQKYMAIDPARAGHNHGRGIAQANATSFDKLSYNEAGTKAVAFVSNVQQLEW